MDNESAVTKSTISTEKAKVKKKRKQKVAAPKVEEVYVSLYEEYELDEKDAQSSVLTEPNTFLAKLRLLKQILALVKPPEPTKGKKKGKVEELPQAVKEELEEDKKRLILELQDEIETETYNYDRKVKREAKQMEWREVQLFKTQRRLNERKKAFTDYLIRSFEEDEWSRYVSCSGLPDPTILSELNTFLYQWSLDDKVASMKTLPRQCEIVIYLLNKMDEIIEFSILNTPEYIKNIKEIRQNFRARLEDYIDRASYQLLRHIDRDTVRMDLKNAKYVEQLSPLACCFWAFIRQPISIKVVADKDKKPVEVNFEEVGLKIRMPLDVNCYCTAIRVLWYGFDHYSDQAASYEQPQLPKEIFVDKDLLTFCRDEYDYLTSIRAEQSESRAERLEEKRAMVRTLMNPPAKKDDAKKDKKGKKGAGGAESNISLVTPLPPLPNPEEMILQREDELRKESRRLLFTRCKKTEINLRKYAILGGVYRVDLIRQPPQPKDMQRDIFLTTLQLPTDLELVNFWRPYKAPPPAPDADRTPEIIEAEMKALEAAMEALILITLKLPDTVMWFEPPLVAHWLPDEQSWSTENVHDIKYNEEQQTITFRTGRLGIHGLAGYRFVNLPFQNWELKPGTGKHRGSAVLSLTGAIIQLEFIVKEDLVCLHSIVGGGSTALEALIDQYMKLHILINEMRASGCDVFPDADVPSYIKGLSLKHKPTANHLISCMGILCKAYIFSWSRWNATRAYREIVVQIKECHGCLAKDKSNSLLLVTPQEMVVVKCSEASTEFNKTKANKKDKFYADVYHYVLSSAGIKSRLSMQDISFKLSNTVTKLLERTNIINMSA